MNCKITLTAKEVTEILVDHLNKNGMKVEGITSFKVDDGDRGSHSYCGPNFTGFEAQVIIEKKS